MYVLYICKYLLFGIPPGSLYSCTYRTCLVGLLNTCTVEIITQTLNVFQSHAHHAPMLTNIIHHHQKKTYVLQTYYSRNLERSYSYPPILKHHRTPTSRLKRQCVLAPILVIHNNSLRIESRILTSTLKIFIRR
jgi:hypothetical protein